MKRVASAVLLVAIMFGLSFAAEEAPSSRDAQSIAQARKIVTELITAEQIPGFSIAVARGGKVVWSEGFGLSDVEQDVPSTPLTRFRLGSVSKVITAAGVARLVEDGTLDLTAPVQRYVPTFPAKSWPFTTRQLTAHAAGIRHYRRDDYLGPLKGAPHFESVQKALTIFQDDPLLFEPGTGYGYSTYGWSLVGAVMEGASNTEFLAYMQGSVFEPMGLHHITPDHVDAIVPQRTRFYMRDARGTLRHAPHVDNSYKWAGGGFLSTAEDLVRFGSAHLQPGFFRQSTLDLLFTRQNVMPDGQTGVGIGWRIGVDPQGRRILHHGGTIEGGRAMLMVFPDSKVVVAMLSNLLADFGEQEAQRIGALFVEP